MNVCTVMVNWLLPGVCPFKSSLAASTGPGPGLGGSSRTPRFNERRAQVHDSREWLDQGLTLDLSLDGCSAFLEARDSWPRQQSRQSNRNGRKCRPKCPFLFLAFRSGSQGTSTHIQTPSVPLDTRESHRPLTAQQEINCSTRSRLMELSYSSVRPVAAKRLVSPPL